MKFIFCSLSLSAIVLCFRSVQAIGHSDLKKFTISDYQLIIQQDQIEGKIFQAFKKCNQTWTVTHEEGTKMFQFNPQFLQTTNASKCLMDCTMRSLGLMSDGGFHTRDYMKHIKQLLLSYSTPDIAAHVPYVREGRMKALKKFSASHDVILSYEMAAKKCKHEERLNVDICEGTFRIVQCIYDKGIEGGSHLKVFPMSIN